MQNPRLAFRYAKSLLDLAVEQNSLAATLSDMQLLDSVCRQSNDFTVMLRSPVINADKKQAVINALLGDKMNPLTKGFVMLLITKTREASLPEIATSFITQYQELMKISTVRLTTATPVGDSVKDAIKAKVAASMPDQQIDLQTEVNPALIGGFILEIGDKLIDASVRKDLYDIRKEFVDKSYTNQMR